MTKKVLSDVQAAKLMYAIDDMDEYYRREIIGIPSRIRVAKILQELGRIKNKKILDVGCEAGHVTIKLAEKGAQVVAIDFIAEPLVKFKEILSTMPAIKKRIKIKQADARKLLFRQATFDAIVATEVIEHMSNLTGFINGAYKALKPQGKLIITFPNEALKEKLYPLLTLLGINANVESQVTLKSYTVEEIQKQFAKKFKLRKYYRLPWWCPVTNLMVFAKTSSTTD